MKSNRPIIRILKIAGAVFLIIIGSMVVIVSAFLVFPDFFVNRFAKERIEKVLAENYPAYSFSIGSIHYNVWGNHVVFNSLSLASKDSSFACTALSAAIRDVHWLKILTGNDTAYFSYLARTHINAESIVLTFPTWHYELRCHHVQISVPDSNMVAERIDFSPLVQGTADTSLSCTITSATLKDVDCLKLLHGDDTNHVSPFVRTHAIAENVVFNFPRTHYELRCDSLRVSVPDSELVAEALDLRPLVPDVEFFGDSKFRKTRFRFKVPQTKITGYHLSEMMEGKKFAARSVELHDATLDVLINKDKPSQKDTPNPRMPYEIVGSLHTPIQFDNINIINARLMYGEQFTAKGKPALISLDNLDITMKGISNLGPAIINAKGLFMKEGKMNIQMILPLSGQNFSLRYSGSVTKMNIESLNPFLVIAEKMRIKSGYLREGSFDIRITGGRAQGSVHAIYNDLTVATLDKETLKESGIIEQITSFLANLLKLRKNNFPEESSEPPKIGKVSYTKKADDPFFRVVWFSLRSGVGDIVGF